jgi:cysteinyl-tRNA synthetase
MSAKHLGKTFDIHAGGIDLIFPHHENEVAQSRCCFGTPVMANVWLHNGFLQVEGEKMSKSLGNFITIRDVLKDWPGEVVRLTMLKTHYRQPIDWTLRGLEESSRVLDRWYNAAGDTPAAETVPATVLDALCDDLNTPAAINALHGSDEAAALRAGANLFGLLTRTRSDREQDQVADRARDALAAMGVSVKDNKDGTSTWTVAR